jgi:alkaline phosphatase D
MSYRPWLFLMAVTVTACGSSSTETGPAMPSGPPPIVSTFDTDVMGWSFNGIETSETPVFIEPTADYSYWDATGGNPGGALSRMDDIGITDYFRASPAFNGDLSAYYGGTLAFDIRDSSADAPFDDALILLQSGTNVWRYDGGPAVTTDWASFSVPLDASAPGWTLTNNSSAATEDSLRAGFADVTALWIRGEFSSAEDNSWIDNVVLSH